MVGIYVVGFENSRDFLLHPLSVVVQGLELLLQGLQRRVALEDDLRDRGESLGKWEKGTNYVLLRENGFKLNSNCSHLQNPRYTVVVNLVYAPDLRLSLLVVGHQDLAVAQEARLELVDLAVLGLQLKTTNIIARIVLP